jgi:hypothetical protein
MALKAEMKGGAKPKDVPQAGTHMARLVGLTDLGHQPGFQFKGNDIPSAYKIEFTYELPNSKTVDGRPHWISEDVKVNSFEGKGIISTMMARVRTLDPDNDSEDGKDLQALLTKPCMVTVSMGENGYPKLKGQACVSGIPMGMEVPELENPSFAFDMDDPDMDLYEGFPEFKKGKLKAALNYEETSLSRELALEDSL